jgi:hypothetical protein
MNALKHGLDAKTLILPSEDETAYRERRAMWEAAYPPRDALEASLLEQAVQLTWQVDRADRACAAHLAQRIRLMQSPEYRRQQAEAEAAVAAEIGEQLLAGPPPPRYNLAKIHARLVQMRKGFWAPFTPIFDLPSTQARMAQKRLGKPIPPDDPSHPELLLRRLRSTATGCHWLLERWTELRAALADRGGWQQDERLRAVRLLAKLPADGLDDPTVRSIYLCCFVLGGTDPYVLEDQAKEMADREFHYFLERMKGRALPGERPASPEAARISLLALVDDVIGKLQSRAAMHAARAEDALTSDRLAFDGSPAGRRMQRCQSRLVGSLLRTINLLMAARRRPDATIPRPKPAESAAASAKQTTRCEDVRNEANADPGSGVEPALSGAIQIALEGEPSVGLAQPDGCHGLRPAGCTGSSTTARDVVANPTMTLSSEGMRNEATTDSPPDAGPPVGWVQSTGCQARPSVGCTHPAAKYVSATQDGSMNCEEIRNEANAEGEPEFPEAGRLPKRDQLDEAHGPAGTDHPIDAGPPGSCSILRGRMSGLALTSVRG